METFSSEDLSIIAHETVLLKIDILNEPDKSSLHLVVNARKI